MEKSCYIYPLGIYSLLIDMDHLPFLHGALHWLGMAQDYTLVSFCISNEVYNEIPLPEQIRLICNVGYMERGVSILRGMLCCNSTSYIHGKDGTFKLWVMKDYNVKGSWLSSRPKYWFAENELLQGAKYWKDMGFVFGTSKEPFGLWSLVQEGFVYTESMIFPKLAT